MERVLSVKAFGALVALALCGCNVASASQAVGDVIRMPSVNASSCSSAISPTISSSASSIVTIPDTPPNSSVTTAMWVCVR